MGPIIRYQREKRGIAIGAVCIQTGIQKPQYVAIEEGKKEVLLNTWKRICDVIGLDFVYLFKNQEVYDQLYEVALHTLLYDDMEEQKKLFEQINGEDIEHSIFLPKFTLLKFLYAIINNVPDEIEALLSCLSYFKTVFSMEELRLYYDYLGFYHMDKKDYALAIQYYKQALDLPTLQHKELVYYHRGILYYKMNDPMIALYYFQEAYQGFEKSWNVNRLLYTKGSMGICYSRMGEFQLAQFQMKETLTLARQYHNDYVVTNTYDNLSFNSFKMRDYEACIGYGKQALQRNSTYPYLYFYLAYSALQLHEEAQCLSWMEAYRQGAQNETTTLLMGYVELMLQKEVNVEYVKQLYEHLVVSDILELQKFVLYDLADFFHERQSYEHESSCLRELIKITRFQQSKL